jgi:hypothetical protein
VFGARYRVINDITCFCDETNTQALQKLPLKDVHADVLRCITRQKQKVVRRSSHTRSRFFLISIGEMVDNSTKEFHAWSMLIDLVSSGDNVRTLDQHRMENYSATKQ